MVIRVDSWFQKFGIQDWVNNFKAMGTIPSALVLIIYLTFKLPCQRAPRQCIHMIGINYPTVTIHYIRYESALPSFVLRSRHETNDAKWAVRVWLPCFSSSRASNVLAPCRGGPLNTTVVRPVAPPYSRYRNPEASIVTGSPEKSYLLFRKLKEQVINWFWEILAWSTVIRKGSAPHAHINR